MSDFWIWYTKSNPESIVDVYYMAPDSLLTPRRLDIIPKLLYVDSILNHRNRYLSRQLYKENIRAFVGYKYNEVGTEGKNTLSKHFERFELLIKNVKERGFDDKVSSVALDDDGIVIDGIHRAAVAFYLQKELPVFNISFCATRCDYRYFRSRGMSTSCVEYMVNQFIMLNNDTITFAISYYNDSDFYQLFCALEDSYDIIYSKNKEVGEKDNHLFSMYYQTPGNSWKGKRYEHRKYVLLFVKPHKNVPWQRRKAPFLKMVIERPMIVKISFHQYNCRELSRRFFGRTIKQSLTMQYAFLKTVILDVLKIERKEMDIINEMMLDRKMIDTLKGFRNDLVKQLRCRYLRKLVGFLSTISHRRHPNHHYFSKYCVQLNDYSDEEAQEILSEESYNDYVLIKYFPMIYLDNINKSL